MSSFNDFIIRQTKILLENKQQAIFYAVIFAILPFASWLSVALMALVTLRQGAKSGSDVLLPALVMHSIPLMSVLPIQSALIHALMAYVPCYIAALTLRKTMSWQVVGGVLFLQALLGAVVFNICAHDFIIEQFAQFRGILSQHLEYKSILDSSNQLLSTCIWSQLFLGIQILSMGIAAILPLLFARAMQSKIFLPGGFRDELLTFRGGKVALVLLLGVILGAYYDLSFAFNVLPLMICYFLLAGFNLVYFVFARKRQVAMAILLLLLILLKPSFVLFAYVIIGTLDSMFNFRLYLPARVRKSA